MSKITPRWEWRTFGTHFGIAEKRFAELAAGAEQESDELCFLGGSGATVKVRDGLMDSRSQGSERGRPGALGTGHEAAVPLAR